MFELLRDIFAIIGVVAVAGLVLTFLWVLRNEARWKLTQKRKDAS